MVMQYYEDVSFKFRMSNTSLSFKDLIFRKFLWDGFLFSAKFKIYKKTITHHFQEKRD